MSKRTEILDIDENEKIQHFNSCNAYSFYFLDGDGNLLECIARYDLNNENDQPFDASGLLCVIEIGMPTDDIKMTGETLEKLIGSHFWKVDMTGFGTHGDQDGLLLLPKLLYKKVWFPTDLTIEPSSFEVSIQNKGKLFHFS